MNASGLCRLLVFLSVFTYALWSTPALSGWPDRRDGGIRNPTTVEGTEVGRSMRLAQAKSPAERRKEAELKEQAAKERLAELKEKLDARRAVKDKKAEAKRQVELKKQAEVKKQADAEFSRKSDVEKAFLSYEVEGLSWGMEAPEFKRILTGRGYTHGRLYAGRLTFELNKKDLASKITIARNNKRWLWLQISISGKSIGKQKALDERSRMLKAFKVPGMACASTGSKELRCSGLTEMDELGVAGTFKEGEISYSFTQVASLIARAKTHKRVAREGIPKRIESIFKKWVATKITEGDYSTPEKSKHGKAVRAFKNRLDELYKSPPTVSVLKAIQKESRIKYPFMSVGVLNRALSIEFGRAWGSRSQMIKILAQSKALDIPEHMLSTYPATANGFLQFTKDFESQTAGMRKMHDSNMGFTAQGYPILYEKYGTTLKAKSEEYFLPALKAKIAEAKLLQGEDYGSLRKLEDINDDVEKITDLALHGGEYGGGKGWPGFDHARPFHSEYTKTYEKTRDSMVVKSIPVLVGWIDSLPPSITATKELENFNKRTFGNIRGKDTDPRFKRLYDAIRKKKKAYNPERYIRPEIVISLQKEHWWEVKYAALNDMAYFMTTFKSINKRCPGVTTDGQKQVFGSRLFEKGLRESIMTSSDALSDTRKFMSKNSCSSDSTRRYIINLIEFSDSTPRNIPSDFIPEFPYR